MQESITEDLIGYDEIIESSMRRVIHQSLKKVEKSGIPGKHYFVITFLTNFPGTIVSKPLKDKHPQEMTIVLQHQYKSLIIDDEDFKISLSFNGKYEKLIVPYRAITSFCDPHMNFALKFSINYDDLKDFENDSNQVNENSDKSKKLEKIDLSAKIVSLDAFRKNKNTQ